MLRRVFVGMLLTVTALPFVPGVAAAEESWKLVGGPTEVSRTLQLCLLCPTDRPPSWELTGGPGALTSTVTDPMLEFTMSVSIGWTVPNVLIPFDDLGSLVSPGPNDGYLVIDSVIGFAGGAAPPTGEYSVASISAFLLVMQEAPPPGLYGTATSAILLANGSVVASGPQDVQVPSYSAGTGSGTYSTKMWLQVTVKHWGAEIIYQYEYDWVALQPTPTATLEDSTSPTDEWTMPPADPGVEPLGVAYEASGDVYISPASEQDLEPHDRHWQRITPGQRIRLDDGSMVRTGGNGEVVLIFSTGALSRLKASTLLEIKPFRTSQTSQWTMYGRLFEGIAWFYTNKAKEDTKQFEVETDRAILTIKGTTFEVAATEASTIVTVTEGVVELTDKATGAVIDVGPGERATVDAAGMTKAAAPDAIAPPVPQSSGTDALAPAPATGSDSAGGGSSLVLGVLAAIALAFVALIALAVMSLALQMRRRAR